MKSKIKNHFKNINPTKLEYIIAISIALIMIVTYAYNDLKSLTIWSTNMLDVTFDLKINDYFSYTALNIFNAPHQYVSGTIYNFIPWAIWNIPIWILQRFLNIPILTSPLSLIWSKLFLVSCLVLTLIFTYKIVLQLTKNISKAKWVIFLSLSFFYTYVGVFYAGQTDIMISLLGTLAIYALINKKDKLFLTFSAFAISIKYFFFFPYIAIVLLTEKKLSKIISKLFIGLLPTIVCSLICHFMPMYDVSSGANPFYWMINDFIKGFIPIMNETTLSLFILGLLFTYFIAYIIKPKEEEKNDFIIYFTTVPLMLIFMFTTYEFYRPILLMPFLYILISLKKENWHLNILLETIMTISSAFIMMGHNQNYFFSTENGVKGSLITSIFNLENIKVSSIYNAAYKIPFYDILSSVFASILLGIMLILIVINYPRFKTKYIENKEEYNIHYLAIIRMLIIVPFILYTFFIMFK